MDEKSSIFLFETFFNSEDHSSKKSIEPNHHKE